MTVSVKESESGHWLKNLKVDRLAAHAERFGANFMKVKNWALHLFVLYVDLKVAFWGIKVLHIVQNGLRQFLLFIKLAPAVETQGINQDVKTMTTQDYTKMIKNLQSARKSNITGTHL